MKTYRVEIKPPDRRHPGDNPPKPAPDWVAQTRVKNSRAAALEADKWKARGFETRIVSES